MGIADPDESLDPITFPEEFVWGVATSSYQIEGATSADGRGESIWDRFCSQPGRIADGTNGTDACQHYLHWREDVALIAGLNVDAYRFSVAWPRVLPQGVGVVNGPGLDFYDRLVDELLDAGVTPFPTLYHWDLPQALQDRGGWINRSTAEAFAEFADTVVTRLRDRVTGWATLNEPFVSADHGHLTGEHAPGHHSTADALAAAHHLLLAHGLAGERMRSIAPDADFGIVLNFTPVTAASSREPDRDEARRVDDWENRWYVEPLAGLGYPESTAEAMGWDRSEVLDGDLDVISQPLDFLGVNYYTRQIISADPEWKQQPEPPHTEMGWEIHPDSLNEQLQTLHERYRFPRYLVTENGAAMPDLEREDGRVSDTDRIAYLRSHLAAVHDAITSGVPVDGYFAWSAFDNFEWAHGYQKRFGLIEVDFETMKRTPKLSARWYADVARTGVIERG